MGKIREREYSKDTERCDRIGEIEDTDGGKYVKEGGGSGRLAAELTKDRISESQLGLAQRGCAMKQATAGHERQREEQVNWPPTLTIKLGKGEGRK